nr:uncharacterized protein LOC117277036 [Nicotiana tomentosiformis]
MAQLAMKFVRLELPIFTGTDPTADPQDFLEEVEKATTLMGVKDYRVDAMTVLKYNIKFEKLSRYAPHLIPTEDEKIDRFARGLIPGIRKDTTSGRRNITFTDFVDLAMDLERIHQEERTNREQNKKAHTFGPFSVVPNSGKGESNRGLSGPPQPRMQTTFSSPPRQSSIARGYRGPCYSCGLTGHIRRFCPNGQHGSRAHLTPSMATTSVAPPSPRGNGAHSGHSAGKVPQTTTTSQGIHPRFYSIPTRPTAEASNVFVTVVKFEFPNESIREWKGNIVEPQVLNAFPDIFPDELSSIPPDRVIDFRIDVVPDTQPISIPPYRMAPTKLRELKEQLKDLLDKAFIRPSKAVKFQWSDACERSFQELKARLTTMPVLTLPTSLGNFLVYCDASKVGLGCVLMQKEKVNVVANALSRKSGGTLAHLLIAKGVDAFAVARSSLIEHVKAKQFEDPNLVNIRNGVQSKDILDFSLDEEGVLRMNGRMCVPDIDELRNEIMAEAHNSRYSIHPGSTKMYRDLREIY